MLPTTPTNVIQHRYNVHYLLGNIPITLRPVDVRIARHKTTAIYRKWMDELYAQLFAPSKRMSLNFNVVEFFFRSRRWLKL